MASYFVKNSEQGTYTDVSTMFDGVRILAINNMTAVGEPVNVYNEQWTDGTEDFLVTTNNGIIARKNVDIEVVFIVGDKYENASDPTYDPQRLCDAFVNYMAASQVWIKSTYTGKEVRAYCNGGVQPTTIRLQRGHGNSYILGKISMHTLQPPTDTD